MSTIISAGEYWQTAADLFSQQLTSLCALTPTMKFKDYRDTIPNLNGRRPIAFRDFVIVAPCSRALTDSVT